MNFYFYVKCTFGRVNLKVGRILSLYDSLTSSTTNESYINHGLEDEGGT